jgi:hypothetical protein
VVVCGDGERRRRVNRLDEGRTRVETQADQLVDVGVAEPVGQDDLEVLERIRPDVASTPVERAG